MCRPAESQHTIRRRDASEIVLRLEEQIFGDLFSREREQVNHERTAKLTTRGSIRMVHHDYHDHARDEAPSSPFNNPLQELTRRGCASAPFPVKLQDMLGRVEVDGFSHIVSWQPHGRCFAIHKTQEFKDLLPRYFPSVSKLASFQRQLNLYGFQRITQGADKGSYYHEYFLKGRRFLSFQIQRCKVKGTGVRAKSNPSEEPDLWSYEWVESGDAAAATPASASPSVENGQTHANTVQHLVVSSHDMTTTTKDSPTTNTLLCAWGKTFHMLNDLHPDTMLLKQDPNIMNHKPLLQPPLSIATTPINGMVDDGDDPLYMEQALSDLFQSYETDREDDDQDTSTDTMIVALLMDQVVS